MASQGSSGAPNPPPTLPFAAPPPAHNQDTCPLITSKRNARFAAMQVYNHTITIPEDERGHTDYLHLGLDDILTNAQCMSSGADTGTQFSSFEAAQEYRKLLLAREPHTDLTIPRTQAQQRAHVMALFKAFKCIPAECEDRDDMKKWFIEQRHNNQLVEIKCWEILQECVTRSMRSTNLVEAHEPNKFKFKAGKMTFAERFNIIKETMAVSKTICKHLFDVSFVLKFVDDPAHNRARVESNRVLNGKKAEIMKRGKQEQAKDKDKQAKRPRLFRSVSADAESGEEMDDLEDSDYGETPEKQSTPRKTRSTRNRASSRAPATAFHSTAPAGSMSAPQMRPNMYTPGRMNLGNVLSPYEQSPLASYGSSTGTDRMIDFTSSGDDQFMLAANSLNGHHPRGMHYQQQRAQTPTLLSSPFSPVIHGGMMYASQNPAQQIMRPESAMSQHTLFQPMHDAAEPWNPLVPARYANGGSGFYNGNGTTSGFSMTPGEPAMLTAPAWNPPSTPVRGDDNSDWARYDSAASRFPQQLSPTPHRPGGYIVPEEITQVEQDEQEQQKVDPALTGREGFNSDNVNEEESLYD
ncbi:uncharacterized protein A1O9_08133 [Exophiala aquamarina CBS 119918]|uniref:Uncharacterized protein n=1 Tax=Exophiala aquamarina CBS 119918 TaxID=1182545 RepID=A0A072P7X3_9EURO|nr:uncharacterized protein A1O9_08133 [Exophiala aquamarina CBS 119918]KEF55383.1 hypothetical protein A1O9_08133 [Exophiala aquamarina CBS 119918]